MRILHVNPFYYPYYGGTEKYLHDLCKRLSRRNSVSVVTSKLRNTKEVEEIEGTKVYRVRSIVLEKLPLFLPPPLSIPLSFRRDMLKICEKEEPDIINLHNRFFISFSSLAFWKKSLRAPLFLTLHNARAVGINEETDLFGQLFDDNIGNRMSRFRRITPAIGQKLYITGSTRRSSKRLRRISRTSSGASSYRPLFAG